MQLCAQLLRTNPLPPIAETSHTPNSHVTRTVRYANVGLIWGNLVMFHTYLYITYVYKYGVQPLVSRNTAAATGRLRGRRLPVRQSWSAQDVIKGTLYIYITRAQTV